MVANRRTSRANTNNRRRKARFLYDDDDRKLRKRESQNADLWFKAGILVLVMSIVLIGAVVKVTRNKRGIELKTSEEIQDMVVGAEKSIEGYLKEGEEFLRGGVGSISSSSSINDKNDNFSNKDQNDSASSNNQKDGVSNNNKNDGVGKNIKYELYPFLVDPQALDSAESGNALSELLSKPSHPKFPVISELEDCELEFEPPAKPREDPSSWRKSFWIPSFPGSGAENPTMKGNLAKSLLNNLLTGNFGDRAGLNWGNGRIVKDFHLNIGGVLKHCSGITETIGCTNAHPLVPVNILTAKKDSFQFKAILFMRNPATVIPLYFTYKGMAYHGATSQMTEEGWRSMRDEWFESNFQSWLDIIKFWRGNQMKSDYATGLYLTFEDLMTTDESSGIAMIRELSNVVRGMDYKSESVDHRDGYFEAATSEKDYRCMWYRTAKEEWEREQLVSGTYVPAYKKSQISSMVQQLRAYADEVALEMVNGPGAGLRDQNLVELLRRYAHQIETYARVEPDSP